MFFEKIKRDARKRRKTIVIAEPEDKRVLKAAKKALSEKIVDVLLLGERDYGLPTAGKSLIKELMLAEGLSEARNLKIDEARKLLTDRNYLAAMLVREGVADGYISGSISPTAKTLRPALQLLKEGFVFSYFLMIKGRKKMIFADCALNINPTAKELAIIAKRASEEAIIMGIRPRVAMLSYSTKGSGTGESVQKMKKATSILKRKKLIVDGEIQFDAAINPKVALRKAPGSLVAGKSNVLIFPNLDSGNIGYKIAEYFGGYEAIGPVISGAPVMDLSRGCTEKEAYHAITLLAYRLGK